MTDDITAPLAPPRVIAHGELLIAGLSQRHTHSNAGMPAQWQRFVPYIGHVPHQVGDVTYGVVRYTEDSGTIDYITGVEVSQFSPEPAELSHVRIPRQTYAVFWHAGHVSAVSAAWKAINMRGVRDAQLKATGGLSFERYDQRFDSRTGSGGFEIWVPVDGLGAALPG